MCESLQSRNLLVTMYDPDGMIMLAVNILKVCSTGTSPGYISVINVSMYEGVI